MIYLNVLGQHFVILGSLEVITDLFEKRSSNYSDRKQTTMLAELYVSHSFHLKELVKNSVRCRMGVRIALAFMPYDLSWRKHRKSFHEYFHRNVVDKYQPILRQEVRAFLRRLLVTPDNFFHHVRQ
jgi:cytochrome P450